MKLSKAVREHIEEAENLAGVTYGELQSAWDCLSATAQESELGYTIRELMDQAEHLTNDIVLLLTPP